MAPRPLPTTPVLYSPSRWTIVLLAPVVAWLEDLLDCDPASATLVAASLDVLSEHGPHLGRPLVDSIRGATITNLKELRPGSTGRSEIRVLFVFDPKRRAVLLTAGDKAGRWHKWYAVNVAIAERRYAEWLAVVSN